MRHFPQALFLFWFFFLLLTNFPCGKPAGSRYESATPLVGRLEETFERDQDGKLNVCSDVVLRGLDYKDYGHFLLVRLGTGKIREKCVDVETGYRNRCLCRIGLGQIKNMSSLCKMPTMSSGNASRWIRHRRLCKTGFNSCSSALPVAPSLLLWSKNVER